MKKKNTYNGYGIPQPPPEINEPSPELKKIIEDAAICKNKVISEIVKSLTNALIHTLEIYGKQNKNHDYWKYEEVINILRKDIEKYTNMLDE